MHCFFLPQDDALLHPNVVCVCVCHSHISL